MVSTKTPMTLEQASALRVILKFEFVGKTSELFKDLSTKDLTTLLNTVVKNAEAWSRLDHAVATPMQTAYYETILDGLTLKNEIEVEFSPAMLDMIRAILKNGVYQRTLATANSTKDLQTSIGAMIPVVIVEKNLDAIKKLFLTEEESPVVFYPMKAVEGKQ